MGWPECNLWNSLGVAIVSEMAWHSTGTNEPLGEDQVLLPVDVDGARYQ